MKLNFCENVHNISLYRMYVFYCRCSCAFVAMATYYSFHWLITRKVKVGLYCCLTAGILTELFYKCLLNSPPPSIKKLHKFLILIYCHGNWKSKMLNLTFIAVHSGEQCGPWASGLYKTYRKTAFQRNDKMTLKTGPVFQCFICFEKQLNKL